MRIRLRVTREDGSVSTEEVDASGFQEAKDILMGQPDVIDVAPIARTAPGIRASSNGGMQDAIDQYVGTEQDVKDIVGEIY